MATELFDVPSFNAIQTRIDAILGNGAGDKGYGQTLLSTQLDTSVSVQNYINLRADILKARFHQKGNITAPIPVITSSVDTTTWDSIKATMTNVELDRLVIPPSTHGFSELLVSENSSDLWNSTTSHTVVVSFDNADAMRHYFNTGSYISFTASLTGGLTSGAGGVKKTSWASLLLSIGEIRFRYNATTSTKVTGTTKGFKDLTSSNQIFFTKTYTSVPSNNVYTINAKLSAENEITFTITFTSVGENVTGTLTSSAKSFHAGNADSNLNAAMVNVPKPDVQSVFVLGDATPTFTPYRSSTAINETGTTTSVTVGVTATNFSGPLFYKIIGTMSGKIMSNITASDFIDVPLEGEITIGDNGSTETPLVITANADNLSEGRETFDIEFRTVDDAKAPVVASIVGVLRSSISINDTSLNPPSPVLVFAKQTVKSVAEGSTVSFTINGSNVPNNSTVYWEINSLSGTAVTPEDFKDKVVSGSFKMIDNTYTFDISVIDDKTGEKVESFRVYAYMLDLAGKKITSSQAYSEMMQITDTIVVQPDAPFVALPPTVSSIVEGSTSGVTFKVTTPLWCTKLWYTVVTDLANGTNEVATTDFRDKLVQGFITISSGKGSLTKIAALDALTEGTETFHVDFFTDEARTSNKFSTTSVNITEDIGYVVTRSPLTVVEGSPSGVTFTVSTPYTPNTPQTFLKWTVIGENGTLETSDFYDKLLTDKAPIINNIATITLRPTTDNITEGTESFHLKIEKLDGTFIANSPSVSILEDVRYAISATRTLTTEGEAGINFDITTPYLPLNTKLYWTTVPVSGSITPSDFSDNAMSGYFFINPTTITNTYTLTRAAASDNSTEGNETFYISLRTSSNPASEVARSDNVIITENVRCRIYPSTQVLTEGQSAMTFNITTMKTADNTKIYWKLNPMKGTIAPEDIIVSDNQVGGVNRLSGYALTHNNVASFSLAASLDSAIEDDETFTVSIHLNSVDSQAEDTSSILTIHDVSPFIITSDVQSVKEVIETGDLPTANVVTFTVITPWMTPGTDLYWTTKSVLGGISASDFSDSKTQDTVKVYGNRCTISRQIAADKTTENNEGFAIQIRRNSYTDPVVPNGTSPTITIVDNSRAPEIIDPAPFNGNVIITEKNGKSSVVEGGSVTFVITTTGISLTEDLYWSTQTLGGASLANDLVQTESNAVFHVTGTSDPRGKEITVVTKTNSDVKTGGKVFLFRVHRGINAQAEVLQTYPILITDPIPYTITANPQSISEGGTSTTITVTSPDFNQSIPFAITTNVAGTIFSNDITVSGATTYSNLLGTVLINSSGVGTFTIAAASDGSTEGTESFNVELTGKSVSTTVQITETVLYSLQPTNLQSPYNLSANSDVTFTLTTPKLSQTAIDTGLWWVLVGVNLPGKFSATSGQITGLSTSAYSYTFTIHSLTSDVDANVEVQIRTGSSTGSQITNFTNSTVKTFTLLGNPVVYSTDYIIVLKNAQGQIFTTDTSIAEGSSFSFEITTPKPNTSFTWFLESTSVPTLTETDFSYGLPEYNGVPSVTGSKIVTSGSTGAMSIPLTFTTGVKHGTKTFHLKIQINGVTVPGGISLNVTRTESSVYSIVPYISSIPLLSPYQVSEGTPITFKVATPNVATNKTYKWELVSSSTPPIASVTYLSQLNQTYGTFTIYASSNSGEFTVIVPDDSTTEVNGRTFQVKISDETNTNNTNIVIPASSCPLIKVVDIVSNQYTVTTPATTVIEGESIQFTITKPDSNPDTTVTWWLSHADNSSTFDDTNYTHVVLPNDQTINFSSGSVQRVTITTKKDTTTNVNRTFKMLLLNRVIASTPVITIIDDREFKVTDDLNPAKEIKETATTVNENRVVFTVQTPNSYNGFPLFYRISGAISPNDLAVPTSLTGQTNTVANGSVPFTVLAAEDNKTNTAAKSFYVEFSKNSSFDVIATSNTVNIKDTSFDLPPSIKLSISYFPVPSRIRLGDAFFVECSVEYLTQAAFAKTTNGSIQIACSYTSTNTLASSVKCNNTLPKMSDQINIRTPIPGLTTTLAGSQYISYSLFQFTSTIDTVNDPCGNLDMSFTVIDPITSKPVSVSAPVVFFDHIEKTETITTAKAWTVPAGVNSVTFDLYGGAGQDGTLSYSSGNLGYVGGAGDLVSGTVLVTPGEKFYIDLIAGGAESVFDSKGKIGTGGQGGSGIVVYHGSSKPSASTAGNVIVASAAGGGGGNGYDAGSHGTRGASPTSSSTFTPQMLLPGTSMSGVNANLPTGWGGGGGGGGTYSNTSNFSNPNAVNANGGISYVPSGFTCVPGGAVNQSNSIDVSGHADGPTITSLPLGYDQAQFTGDTSAAKWGIFLQSRGVFQPDMPGGNTSTLWFNQVQLSADVNVNSYILQYAFSAGATCELTINGITQTLTTAATTLDNGTEKSITIPSDWNRTIKIKITGNSAFKSGVTPIGVAATLRVSGTSTILWSTNDMPVKVYDLGGLYSAPGTPQVVLTYSRGCEVDGALIHEWRTPGTYDVSIPEGTTGFIMRVLGAGGGGGYYVGNDNWGDSGAGGGGGARVSVSGSILVGQTRITSVTIVVGKGGSARSSGGTTSVTTNANFSIVARGGQGGGDGNKHGNPGGAAGGTATVTGGDSAFRSLSEKGGFSGGNIHHGDNSSALGGTGGYPNGGSGGSGSSHSKNMVPPTAGGNGYVGITWLY